MCNMLNPIFHDPIEPGYLGEYSQMHVGSAFRHMNQMTFAPSCTSAAMCIRYLAFEKIESDDKCGGRKVEVFRIFGAHKKVVQA